MPIHISTADFDTDWPAIWQVLLESSEDACLSFDQHRDFASQALKETEDEWRRRMVEHVKKTYATDPTSYIVKAVDTNFGNIVGVALWNIYTTSSGLKGATTKQNKWKIYGDEDMTQDANGVQERQVSAMKLVGYPHVFLVAIAAHPRYETPEVKRLLMQWGLDRADSLGLEAWSYSANPDASLYVSSGFQSVDQNTPDLPDSGPSTLWRMCRPGARNRRAHKDFYLDTQGFW
ncbi:hypothetical protein BU26DRAFT_567885 [Trematosphaeria pertusa]|uniref:N-acetyltransferase domain-containing protein n=1 Tax=Trematosphaeria pertusa TaxID=390896 RepID=A0A6A6I4M0_9PLEO|nr:uncharacterized protein BU26DRAFT_567885 [Trematosphaeria pertusa]KAF2245291.1 hypothetical protein BU26DRAFT_567885 [Trematosphaeria pertusa]